MLPFALLGTQYGGLAPTTRAKEAGSAMNHLSMWGSGQAAATRSRISADAAFLMRSRVSRKVEQFPSMATTTMSASVAEVRRSVQFVCQDPNSLIALG